MRAGVVRLAMGCSGSHSDTAGHCVVGNVQRSTAIELGRNRRSRPMALHCPNGHAYTRENIFLDTRGRRCRTCMRQQRHRTHQKQHAAMLAVLRACRWAVRGGLIETQRRDGRPAAQSVALAGPIIAVLPMNGPAAVRTPMVMMPSPDRLRPPMASERGARGPGATPMHVGPRLRQR